MLLPPRKGSLNIAWGLKEDVITSLSQKVLARYLIYHSSTLEARKGVELIIEFTVLFSDCSANTLNLAELFTASLLFGFITTEPHIFEAIGEASVELLAILICHWAEEAKICAIFTYSLLKKFEIASISSSERN
nr:hypothetical protein Iba_chr15dCG4140 [Ipomoea batatas]